jgi:hypothetical protein
MKTSEFLLKKEYDKYTFSETKEKMSEKKEMIDKRFKEYCDSRLEMYSNVLRNMQERIEKVETLDVSKGVSALKSLFQLWVDDIKKLESELEYYVIYDDF